MAGMARLGKLRLGTVWNGVAGMVSRGKERLGTVIRGAAGKRKGGKTMVYSWKTYGYAVDANIVGKEFEKIEAEYGAVTSENVLESAKAEDSPIHNIFEWDDTKAAHQYRLKQAVVLICNLHVDVGEKKPLKVAAYMNVSEEKTGTFINANAAFKNPDTREVVLKRAKAELTSFRKKYRDLQEFAKLFDLIDLMMEEAV